MIMDQLSQGNFQYFFGLWGPGQSCKNLLFNWLHLKIQAYFARICPEYCSYCTSSLITKALWCQIVVWYYLDCHRYKSNHFCTQTHFHSLPSSSYSSFGIWGFIVYLSWSSHPISSANRTPEPSAFTFRPWQTKSHLRPPLLSHYSSRIFSLAH